jgi:hypothetical protein
MTKQTGERVGQALGRVVKVDVQENGIGWGSSLRVYLWLDITKPIPQGRLITFQSLGQMWVHSNMSGCHGFASIVVCWDTWSLIVWLGCGVVLNQLMVLSNIRRGSVLQSFLSSVE